MAPAFFPFNPRTTRLGFLLGALGCAGLTLWALWGALRHTERLGEARAGISAGLMFAFLYAFLRLRPHAGWGVTVDDGGVTVARPLSPEAIRLPWPRITHVRRIGKRQETVALVLDDDSRVLVARHLFPRRQAFDAMVDALRHKVPEPELDA